MPVDPFKDVPPGDRGPVLPLYLNLRETQDLVLAIQVLTSLDVEILTNPETAWSADMRDLGRADQVRATARDRQPRLLSLNTALLEHMHSLERERDAHGYRD